MDVVRTLIFLAILAGLVWWLRKRFASPETPPRQAPAATITEAEAREILGVTPHASREEIINQHRKLMQKVHPDAGGSTYLAQQLNEAKRVLLERR
ncbi:MAG: hypothetical protein FJ194_03190 [Gammaproteobacteria bacterium]|nr:hypothetical protein [Gammaproteobacteria bacterium]